MRHDFTIDVLRCGITGPLEVPPILELRHGMGEAQLTIVVRPRLLQVHQAALMRHLEQASEFHEGPSLD